MKRRRIKKKIIVGFFAFLIVALVSALVIFIPNRLHDTIIIEAGEIDGLHESLFLKDDYEGTFTTDISTIDLKELNNYEIKIKVGYFNYKSTLSIVDTIAPIIRLKSIISPIGQKLTPNDFIVDFEDQTDVTFEFVNAPDFEKSGEYEVSILARDAGNNTTIVNTSALISQVKEVVIMEAGEQAPSLDEFLLDEKTTEEFITDLSKIKLTVGVYPIEIRMNERVLLSFLEVVDTTSPTANPRKVEVYVNDTIKATQFVSNIIDASKVTVSFKDSKNWTSSAGTFNPIIVLRDESDNIAEIESTLVVKKDTIPPVISGSGVANRTVYVGEPYNVSNNVYANDNRDGRIAVKTIGSVDFDTANQYPITFSATDRAGNTTSKEIVVNVIIKPPFVSKASTSNAQLDNLVDSIFKDILHGDMSTYEVVKAIDSFGRTIRYQAGPLQSEWTSRAITSLTTRTGNCFGRMYAMKAMFTRAGISNREQIKYNSEHSWNQVDIGSGWQNIDVGFRGIFLVSDAYLKNHALTTPSIKDDNWDTELQ